MSFFLFASAKFKNKKVEQVLPRGRLVPVGVGRGERKGIRGWVVYKCCVHMYVNAKMTLVDTIPVMGGKGIKGEQWLG
jgi:hypothetical protein